MTDVADRASVLTESPRVDKFEARRAELADATLQTLGEIGYAETSLRVIAAHTDFSHGVLHYYFRDKIELITYCVRRYKTQCVTRYDEVIAATSDADSLESGFAKALADTMVDDAPMHRLWYDLRTQSMFELGLRETVVDLDGQLEAMIWRVVTAYSERSGRDPQVPSAVAYSTFDGLFENSLLRHEAGDTAAPALLQEHAAWLLRAQTGTVQ